jgi:hypothetical protein
MILLVVIILGGNTLRDVTTISTAEFSTQTACFQAGKAIAQSIENGSAGKSRANWDCIDKKTGLSGVYSAPK